MPKRITDTEKVVEIFQRLPIQEAYSLLSIVTVVVKSRTPKVERKKKSRVEAAGINLNALEPFEPVSAEPARNQV